MTILDLETGCFHLSDSIRVGLDISYADLVELVPQHKTVDIKNGYAWIYFKDINIDALNFYVHVCFYNGSLFLIDFGFTEPEQENKTWADWTEENELKRKERYENWLTETIGKNRLFSWGTVSTYYDPRGGNSSMRMKYGHEKPR